MYSTYFKSAIAATLFASTNAHFFIKAPAPIPGNAIKDPLDPSGSNFPCHGADVTQGTVTPLTAGSTFPLKYELGGGANTAVHGGGSCQISLAYTTDATKLKDPANWGVIASFVGGCPTDAKGNLVSADMCIGGNGPECVNALNFKVPAEVTNGDAILAWTWFNNVGNREMYMNCAKVSVSGGSGSGRFPSMFVANLASVNKCTTTESTNIDFPNPGTQVTVESPLNFPKQAPGGTCPAGSGSGNTTPASSAGSGTGSYTTSVAGSYTTPAAGAPPASAPAASTPVAATSSAANNGQYTGIGAATNSATAPKATKSVASNSGGIFAPGASTAVASDAVPTATSIVATTFVTAASPTAATQAASAPATASPTAPASSPASSGSCQSGQVTCTASGFYCIDASTFGMCAFGCATPRKMSSGTDCSNGAVVHTAAHQKRRKQIRNVHRRYADGSF
ncbi:hypothetical protein BLS_007705 [Venturia inaequalis]|uniref:Uncharacterized protein n=1 Tax=Venturia inaequalis TaxID=5025 RepID=A0A8H3V4G0_VENIN|nr:hypothetical protein EG328_012076 [Venturia inaequalis]KAE9981195.1 hypothetical protein BLS_007705 [Venturia inaequalis]KAE9992451.1 hypothetical protein EG327_008967 [Venturia inaequalis]